MTDDKNNRYIKCPVCGAVGNWREYIWRGYCHGKNMQVLSNGELEPGQESDEEEFTEEEMQEIMEEYQGKW
jgi:hypothetical protein